MRHLFRHITVVLVACAAVTGLSARGFQAAAPSQNVKTMAGILANLNHFASDAEKAQLKAIVDSATATAAEKTLAQSMIDLQHTVPAADKAKLETLMKDQSAPESVRTIATVLAHIQHTASDTEKADLKKIASM